MSITCSNIYIYLNIYIYNKYIHLIIDIYTVWSCTEGLNDENLRLIHRGSLGSRTEKTNQANNSIKVRQISCAKCACSVWRIGGYSKIWIKSRVLVFPFDFQCIRIYICLSIYPSIYLSPSLSSSLSLFLSYLTFPYLILFIYLYSSVYIYKVSHMMLNYFQYVFYIYVCLCV